MKKNLYMVQVNASFEGSVYLPYAAGTLVACALKDEKLKESYNFNEIIYLRRDIDEAMEYIDNPFVMAFSNYIWNYEYNKTLAQRVKEKYPDCCIVFGGHNIPKGVKSLDELPYVDVLMFGEGEEPFCDLLHALDEEKELSVVPNIAYRTADGKGVCTPVKVYTDIDYPSPYEMGVFDSIAETAPFALSAILETNRGCPYSCAFCDWGMLKSKIRQFPIQRVFNDIKWMADHKVEYCYCADSNFGIFDRDMDIIDYVIDTYKKNGYPQKFRVNYLKNSDDKVFEINRKLYENGMSKGVTLSFQSMCPETLEIIGRKNISMSRFRELLMRYEKMGLSAYSELILGLPGETYDSFCDGVEELFEAGQHSSLFVYNCELLVNSKIGDEAFREKYEIETAEIPFNQDHFEPMTSGVQEYSHIIVSTSTMNRESWIKTASTSVLLQSLHCLGLLQCIAIYLYNEKGIRYIDFYREIFDVLQNDSGVCGEIYRSTIEKIREYSNGERSWSFFDDRFGKISWPIEEGTFLELVTNTKSLYDCIRPCIEKYIDSDIADELIKYQEFIVKKPNDNRDVYSFKYDFYDYFESFYVGDSKPLKKADCEYSKPVDGYKDLKTYAKEIVWFGRRNDRMISSEVEKKLN